MMAQMEKSIGMKCIKYLLCATNFLFILVALLLISIGSTIYAVYSSFENFLDDYYFSPASFLIIIGFVILIISIFGFAGALKESTCMIMFFILMLGIVFILEMTAAILASTNKVGVHEIIERNLNESIHKYNEHADLRVAFDTLQSTLECCGVNDPTDWQQIENVGKCPDSCCKGIRLNEGDQCTTYYSTGCATKLVQLIYQGSFMLSSGALSIAMIQVLGMVFAFMLGKSIRQAKTEREMQRRELQNTLANHNTMYTELTRGDVKAPVIYTPSSTDA